ncbi:MAG: hypothetical protein GY851_29485 [bacterium]|nr:hypothetical protein [bacterium]
MAQQGIESDWSGRQHAYCWEDVRRVRIEKRTHFQQGFDVLAIELPEATVGLRMQPLKGGRRPTWSGPDARTIAAFVLHHVPEERTDTVALAGPALSVKDYDFRLARTGDGIQERRLLVACAIGITAFLVVMFVVKVLPGLRTEDGQAPELIAMVVLLVALMMVVPIAFMAVGLTIPRANRKARAAIEAEREAFLAEREIAPDCADG